MQGVKSTANANFKNEQNFESLFMQSSLPKIVFNHGGYKILKANNAALKLYGYSSKEFLKLNALDIRANKSKIFMAKRVTKVHNSKGSLLLKSKHVTKKNKILSVLLNVNVFFYKGEKVSLRLCQQIDVPNHGNKKQSSIYEL
jgi:PAS domain S-box-containing protein